MIKPVQAHISQLWGANPSYYERAFGIPYHNGTDYAAPLGKPIRAIADGIVSWIDNDIFGYGLYVRIYHPEIKLFSFYAHLSHHTIDIDDRIEESEMIATLGNSGNSTGPHLHFEIRLAADPYKYVPSPYANIARGRINPETLYRIEERFYASYP